ncbi:MAG: sigma 54-interacting transcriptional regulator [Sandaracinaceae bacterium]|nr:sigma 54-interacting transcriptional regulator [Sandaracinaceae bacterium]
MRRRAPTRACREEGSSGRSRAAEGGTLFLDEVAELTLAAQAKLLSLLQSRTYYPLGASRPRHADIRVIAASNVDLRSEVARKRFREDLYYRLNVMEVRVPPLSERVEDIPLLAARFVRVAAQRHGLGLRGLSPGGLRAVLHADWPGNVRELAHRLEAAVLNAHLRGATTVEARDVFDDGATDDEDGESLQEATRRFQKRYVLAALEACDWNVSEAARRLDVARSHAYNLMRLYGLERRS